MPNIANISVSDARKAIAQALNNDEGLYLAYEANIAMYLSDQHYTRNYIDKSDRDQAAEDILNIIFGDLLDKNK